MNPTSGILAVVPDLTEIARAGAPTQDSIGHLALILLVGLVVALGVVVWAALFRKPGGRRGRRERGTLQEAGDEPGKDRGSGHRRRRRRRSSHRGSNPTLSQTGGLPPERDGEPPGTQT